ncbi:hypothetical protein NKJ06_05670, partial [Mesorhizobium sp. M0293]|uniref:hypothetical protein n=1 Tax=unclassified Mesorhizobium TaxID=325217 RepID=UPI00333A07BF
LALRRTYHKGENCYLCIRFKVLPIYRLDNGSDHGRALNGSGYIPEKSTAMAIMHDQWNGSRRFLTIGHAVKSGQMPFSHKVLELFRKRKVRRVKRRLPVRILRIIRSV